MIPNVCRNRPRRWLSHSILFLCTVVLWPPRAAPQDDLEATDRRIFQEIREHNHLMEDLEHLSDAIGPRLTGTDQLWTAETWASDLARQYRLENVHLEAWKIAHAWKRGPAQARIVNPVMRNFTIASAGWSPATAGQIRGKVVFVSATNLDELKAYSGKLAGTVAIFEQPADLTPEVASANPSSWTGPSIQAPAPASDRNTPSPEDQFNAARLTFLRNEGVAAVLLDSGKHNGLLTVTNAAHKYEIAELPTGTLTHEDYSLIWRLLKKGPVEVEVSLNNSFSGAPVEVHNTVAEIHGTQRPDEIVILCAHLDSWDLGSGSTDDGTGVVAVLEAARAIRALNLQPRRTIRIVLFTGEEQGEAGSREYIKQHKTEWNKISAVLADDTGTSRILTLRLHQNYAARKIVDTTLAPLEDLELIQPWMERFHGSDYASFNDVGVPGFSLIGNQTDYDYDQTHHTQADTFDKVNADGVIHHAQVLAGWAFNTAQLPDLLPRN
ncbi:MAG: M20/M25/M40 family metallo-hydrolase [Candidatus Sulfotelmatobacter sp.]|jgi:Zn-dependent M28 family amino/carboxypeptidase